MDFKERCTIAEKCLPMSDYRTQVAMLHNDLIERIEELETALATTERAYREQKDGFELLRDEMKEIALALGRSKTDGESDCDWYDMAGEIREQKERADRLEKLLNPPPKLMRFVE